jgi:hypothetical protein
MTKNEEKRNKDKLKKDEKTGGKAVREKARANINQWEKKEKKARELTCMRPCSRGPMFEARRACA